MLIILLIIAFPATITRLHLFSRGIIPVLLFLLRCHLFGHLLRRLRSFFISNGHLLHKTNKLAMNSWWKKCSHLFSPHSYTFPLFLLLITLLPPFPPLLPFLPYIHSVTKPRISLHLTPHRPHLPRRPLCSLCSLSTHKLAIQHLQNVFIHYIVWIIILTPTYQELQIKIHNFFFLGRTFGSCLLVGFPIHCG